jgi:hypothetical protein
MGRKNSKRGKIAQDAAAASLDADGSDFAVCA